MRRPILLALLASGLLLTCRLVAEEREAALQRVAMTPAADMRRAEVVTIATVPAPVAVLVLCPGCNGDGAEWIRQPLWQQFAREHALGLVGICFFSDVDLLRHDRGYYYASQGSGQILLGAIRRIYQRDLPLMLYGFSGGAHFTSRFVAWAPDRVLTWCAYSAAWWDQPQRRPRMPAGLVACGEEDGERYGASLTYFKQGRAAGNNWAWVSLPKTAHVRSPALEAFVRAYFAARLTSAGPNRTADLGGAEWRDIGTKELLGRAAAEAQPSESAWLPDHETANHWAALHVP